MADLIYMCGAKGGSGATTCSVLLGAALSRQGERTLILDGDRECADGLEICGLQGLSVYTLADVESGACRVKQAVLQHPRFPNLYILPTLGCENLLKCDEAVRECESLFDKIICDGVAKGVCNRTFLVCEPYSSSVTAARKKSALLRDGGFKEVELIVNKVNGGLVFGGAILTPHEIADVARAKLLGVIPEDLSLPLGKIKPCTQRAFSLTAKRADGGEEKVFGVIKPYTGIKGLIKRKIRDFV